MAATNHSPAYDEFGYVFDADVPFASELRSLEPDLFAEFGTHKHMTPLERDLFRKARAMLHDVPGVAEAWIEKECVELDYGAMTDREWALARLVDTVAEVCWCDASPGQPGTVRAFVAETEAQQRDPTKKVRIADA